MVRDLRHYRVGHQELFHASPNEFTILPENDKIGRRAMKWRASGGRRAHVIIGVANLKHVIDALLNAEVDWMCQDRFTRHHFTCFGVHLHEHNNQQLEGSEERLKIERTETSPNVAGCFPRELNTKSVTSRPINIEGCQREKRGEMSIEQRNETVTIEDLRKGLH